MLDSVIIREKMTYENLPQNLKEKPLFCLVDISEKEAYYLFLEKGSSAEWKALKRANAFRLSLYNQRGEKMFYFERSEKFYMNKMEVFDSTESCLGVVQKGGKFSKGLWEVLDSGDHVLYHFGEDSSELETFHIFQGGTMVGKITRRPFCSAEGETLPQDRFGILFPLDADLSIKSVLLGGLFLIDLLHA